MRKIYVTIKYYGKIIADKIVFFTPEDPAKAANEIMVDVAKGELVAPSCCSWEVFESLNSTIPFEKSKG